MNMVSYRKCSISNILFKINFYIDKNFKIISNIDYKISLGLASAVYLRNTNESIKIKKLLFMSCI